MEFLLSILRRDLVGKPVVASPNVGSFLRQLGDHLLVTHSPILLIVLVVFLELSPHPLLVLACSTTT